MSSSTASNCALCHNQRRARRDETSKEKVSITPLGSPLPLGEGEGDRGQPAQRRLSEIGPIDQASIFRKFFISTMVAQKRNGDVSLLSEACRKRSSDRLLDLPQQFSTADKQGSNPSRDKDPGRQNGDRIAATAAAQHRCWRVCESLSRRPVLRCGAHAEAFPRPGLTAHDCGCVDQTRLSDRPSPRG